VLLLSTLLVAAAQAPRLELAKGEPVPTNGWATETYRIRSQVLGEDLRVFVGKPPSWKRTKRGLPLLLLLDGQWYFDEVLPVVAALGAQGQIPAMVLVAVESRDRRVDFTPEEIVLPDVGDRARAGKYLEFLERELVPAAETTLRAGRPRVLVGHSHSAMLALYAVARRPKAFPWVLAIDAPTHHEESFLARDVLRLLGEKERPLVRIESLEAVFGFSDEAWARLQAAARPGDVLGRHAMTGETHEGMVFASAYRGFQAIFADGSSRLVRDLAPLEVEAHYKSLASRWGVEIDPPEPVLRRIVEDFLLEGRGERADAWLERYVAAYGEPDDLPQLRERIEKAKSLGEPTETVAELLALPRATPAEMKDHLGEWRGATQRGDGPKEPFSARFWVEEGVVQGRLAHPGGPDIPLEYIRFRADGVLEFGFKNGMRPRGLIMYTETKAGGPLEGVIEFRGMRFTLPPGEGERWIDRFQLERE
jgi:hypothetical protein